MTAVAPRRWRATRSVRVLGRRIRLESNRPEALAGLLALLPPIWAPVDGSRAERVYALRVKRGSLQILEDGRVVSISPTLDLALRDCEWHLKAYLAEHARRRVIVHAGVVGWNGRAIVLPGASMSGKTSLVAELLRLGASYYSDEYAVLDMRGRVHPYPTPLQIRDPQTQVQTPRPPHEFGGAIGVTSLPVGLVVACEYRRGARWRPRRLSSGEAVLRMVGHTVSARRSPALVLPFLTSAVAEAMAWTGVRGDVGPAARWILAAADGPASPSDSIMTRDVSTAATHRQNGRRRP